MSQENVDRVRRGYEALAQGDFQALFEILHPAVEMSDAENFPEVGTYRGHQGVLDFLAQQTPVWDDFRLVPERFLAVGDDGVLVLHRQTGRSKQTGLRLDAPYAHFWTVREGQAVRCVTYSSWEEALEAVGLSEVGDVGRERRGRSRDREALGRGRCVREAEPYVLADLEAADGQRLVEMPTTGWESCSTPSEPGTALP